MTVTGVTAETVLQSATIPADDPQTASVYRIVGYGVLTAASGALGWTVRWGGVTGKVIASLPNTNVAPVVTSGSFKYNAATPYIQTPTTATTVSTTAAADLVVDVTPSVSGDTITVLGGYIEKIR